MTGLARNGVGDPARALRVSAIDMMDATKAAPEPSQSVLAHPYYWAGFAVFGSGMR